MTNNIDPYLVIVIVHGNHISIESSEIGYDYLGKILASQGFIAMFIDENFFDGPPSIFVPVKYGKISKIEKIIFFSSDIGPHSIVRAFVILEILKHF